MFEFVGNTSTGNGHNEDLMDIDFSAPTKEFQPILPGLEQSVHSFEYTHSLIDDGRSRGGHDLAGTLTEATASRNREHAPRRSRSSRHHFYTGSNSNHYYDRPSTCRDDTDRYIPAYSKLQPAHVRNAYEERAIIGQMADLDVAHDDRRDRGQRYRGGGGGRKRGRDGERLLSMFKGA